MRFPYLTDAERTAIIMALGLCFAIITGTLIVAHHAGALTCPEPVISRTFC